MQTFELLLNLVWGAVAIGALGYAARRRSRIVFGAVLCAIVLLFPIISASDDLQSAVRTIEDGFAAILAVAGVIFALVMIARLSGRVHATEAFAFPVHADPRSPPLG
jgi:predicted Co/Zn/Cd cation transporter (cation efflux family)